MKKLLALVTLVGFAAVATVEAATTRSSKGTEEAPKAPAKAAKKATKAPKAPAKAPKAPAKEEAFPDREFTDAELVALEKMALEDGILSGEETTAGAFPDREFNDAELLALEEMALEDRMAKESEVTEETVKKVKAKNSFFAPVVKAYNASKDFVVEHPVYTAAGVATVAAVTTAIIYRKEIAKFFNKNKRYSTLAQLTEAKQSASAA